MKISGIYKITNTVTGDFYKEYNNQLCSYNGETISLAALYQRFQKSGVEHPVLEAKKYILKKESKNAIEFYDVYP